MRRLALRLAVLTLSAPSWAATPVTPSALRAQPAERFVTVSDGTKLQLLDWGGPAKAKGENKGNTGGETILLLAGLGNSAYIYTDFAPRLTSRFHVIALTRRGHGRSGPAHDVTPKRLARDVRDVLDALKISRATLVGHSLAGEELTAFARAWPQRVLSLVYIDAAYDRKLQSELDRKYEEPVPWKPPSKSDLASVPAYLQYRRNRAALPGAYYGQIWSHAVEADTRETLEVMPDGSVRERPMDYEKFVSETSRNTPDYRATAAPILAIYAASDHYSALPPQAPPALVQKAGDYQKKAIIPWTETSIRELRSQRPDATIVTLPGLHHLFITNAPDVAAMITKFITGLDKLPAAGAERR
jgi:pimeloyl-ACP methyl ester carboxylesterase